MEDDSQEAGMVPGETPDGGVASSTGAALATRRRVLDGLLCGSFLAWMGVLFFPILRYLKRPPEVGGGSQVGLSDEDKKRIGQNGFIIVRLGTDRVIVFEDAQKILHALQAKCTHEGCTVTYKADEGLVWCACHNGKFAIDGRVISGPPPKALPVYAVEGTLGSKLTISRQGA